MNWLERIFHIHEWERTGSYASLKDIFASPPGNIDRSGTIYTFQECSGCHQERTHVELIGKDGLVEREYFR